MSASTTENRVIEVGDIIANPQFDVNCGIKIVEDETVLWDGYGCEGCPAEWLGRPVTYMTVRDNAIVIEI